jgi:hypothetical protein
VALSSLLNNFIIFSITYTHSNCSLPTPPMCWVMLNHKCLHLHWRLILFVSSVLPWLQQQIIMYFLLHQLMLETEILAQCSYSLC